MALPRAGLEAVLVLAGFRKQVNEYKRLQREIGKATKTTAREVESAGKGMATSLDELIKSSKLVRQSLPTEALDQLGSMFGNLSQGMGVNVAQFETMIQSGASLTGAFEGATTAAGGATTAVGGLGIAIGPLAAGFGLAATAIGALVRVSDDAIDRYMELAFQVRRVQLELGTTTAEASRQVAIAETLGVSVNAVSRAMLTLNDNISDLQLRTIEGNTETTKFTRAMERLGVSVIDAQGNYRSILDVQQEVIQTLGAEESAAVRAALARDLMGRSGRDMLPILNAEAAVTESLTEFMNKWGLTMTQETIPAAERLSLAQQKTKVASDGVKMAITALTGEIKVWVETVKTVFLLAIRRATQHLYALSQAILALVEGRNIIDAYNQALEEFSVESQKAAEAQQELAIATAAAEEALERQEAAYQKILEQAEELQQEVIERREDLERQWTRRWEDIMLDRERQIEDAERRATQRRADLWEAYQQRREDIIADWNRRQLQREKDWAQRLADFEEDANRRRRKLLERHLERMRQIRQRFSDAANEAARRRDAIAFLQAMRRRDRELRDERRRYDIEKRDLEEQIADRRRKLERAIEEERRRDEQRLEDALARAERNYNRQVDALEKSLRRQEEARELSWARQEEDFNISQQRQLEDMQRWFAEQLSELQLHLEDRVRLWRWYREQVAEIRTEPGADTTTTGGGGGAHERGGGHLFRQRGGVDIVSRPTPFMFGEGNMPEMIVSVPLGRTMQHVHNFGRLDGRIEGIGGLSERQIISLVTNMIMAYARSL